jgi:HPt (histidine-containing phosphotransfer) domain-containing protein
MCPTKECTVSEQIFDREAALARVGDDEELLVELVKIFLNDYPQSLSAIEEAVAKQDPPRLERAAHTLKGAVANFGAEPVVRQAYALERLGKMGDLSRASESLRQLHEALHQLEYELRPIANSN